MKRKHFLATAAALAALAALASAGTANADVFKYTMENGDALSLDTATGSGTLVGSNINVSFSAPEISTFKGGLAPVMQTFTFTSLSGTQTVKGQTFVANLSHLPPIYHDVVPSLVLVNKNDPYFLHRGLYLLNLWGTPSDPNGNYLGGHCVNTSNLYTSNCNTYTSFNVKDYSSTPDSTSGGGSSSGGVPVPEPANLALFGLGVGALLIGRRCLRPRRKAA